MAVTEFVTEIENGPITDNSITIDMIATSATQVTLWGPVIIDTGTITALPQVNGTTTASDPKIFGVCVRLPRNGTITANVSHVEVCIFGICKIKVNDATVNLDDKLVTHTTAGEAAVQAAFVISATYSETEVQNAFKGVAACFARALSTVTSGADSIVAAFVNLSCFAGAS